MGSISVPQSQQVADINAAAKRYNIPPEVLTGVYAMETSLGSDVSTSSAGAMGPFQFIPSTAHSYAYPLTNNPTPDQFRAQADSAAHYLSDLYKQTGSWDTALRHYSGGGYGEQDIYKKLGGYVKPNSGLFTPVGDAASSVAGTVNDVVNAATSVPEFLGKLWHGLTDPRTWLRLAMGIGALVLLFFGLTELAGEHGQSARSATTRVVPVPV